MMTQQQPFVHQRIARNLDQAKSHYTVLVVGSGYGAGVAASRLARAGQDVCVLERGKEILPGEFPNKLSDARGAMQFNVKGGRIGSPDALFEVHVNDDQYALVGCGLGGTSLINANVSLELDKRLLDQAHWPAVFRDDPHAIDPYYERAREMLAPNAYPDTHPKLGKLEALEHSAKTMGRRFYKTPINVTFEDKTNRFGVPQPACNNCGDCVSGCNIGAKNTTLMNYLPDAANHGAEIFTGAKVLWIERVEGDGGDVWRVHIARNGEDTSDKPLCITADHVVLGAGALGSTEILLRSREKGLSVSDRLGTGFSGNGDALGFAYDSYLKAEKDSDNVTAGPIYAMGVGTSDVSPEVYPGPCITGIIDMRDSDDPAKGRVIEEGVAPGILATALAPAFFFGEALADGFTRFGFDQVKPRLLDAKAMGEALQTNPASIADWAYKGPMARTQTYLVMSVDDAGGSLALEDDRIAIHWPKVGEQRTFRRDDDSMCEAAEAIEAQYFSNPLWSDQMGRKLLTVHPIGGCGMGDDATSGVVDDSCRVFAGKNGAEVHHGLYVCDGAALPGAVGVNPLLTITAVAERAVEMLAQREGWTIDYTLGEETQLPQEVPVEEAAAEAQAIPHVDNLKLSVAKWVGGHAIGPIANAVVDAAKHFESGAIEDGAAAIRRLVKEHPEAMSPGLSFTETMAGHISATGCHHRPCGHAERIRDDYVNGAAWGQAEHGACSFKLTVTTDNLHRMIDDPQHRARITGEVSVSAISPDPLPVREGTFSLLIADPDRAESWKMLYDMVLEGPEGPIHFHGFKTLEQRGKSDPWTDLTTLFVTLRHGEDESGALIGRGVLKLGIEAFMHQLNTIAVHDADTLVGHIVNLVPRARKAIETYFVAKFAGFFAMTVFRAYGGMLATLNDFAGKEAKSLCLRELRLPPPERYVVPTGDGVNVGLTRYRGGARGPLVLAPGFSVRASSFATPTVDENLAESLVAQGYDVWLFDYRASADSGNDTEHPPEFTIDDIARYDWPAAVSKIRSVTGADSVQALAHCVGSMSLLMGIGAGWVQHVRSLISSQLTLHPVTDWLNYMKADLGVADMLGQISLLDGHIDFVSQGTEADYEIDAVAYQIPVPEGQACKNPTCRRVFGVFGPSWDHRQLGHDTHLALGSMFSRVSLTPFKQLGAIMHKGLAVNADGQSVYTDEAAAHRLALPITFLSGATNQIFYPESGQRTRVWLSDQNGSSLYRQRIIPDYGHMDLFIGRNAHRDVTPCILEELERLDRHTGVGTDREIA
ncbi:GMC oxidoreductase [Altererythrobacter sp.]|uniref:GMC oxidoreductase n=1 Tax=Altererythrobacter sp. TaxID=1872480 RepID=UPI003D0962A6